MTGCIFCAPSERIATGSGFRPPPPPRPHESRVPPGHIGAVFFFFFFLGGGILPESQLLHPIFLRGGGLFQSCLIRARKLSPQFQYQGRGLMISLVNTAWLCLIYLTRKKNTFSDISQISPILNVLGDWLKKKTFLFKKVSWGRFFRDKQPKLLPEYRPILARIRYIGLFLGGGGNSAPFTPRLIRQ